MAVLTGSIVKELGIPCGITAIVGGGGKTTLMQALAEELAQHSRVIVTTTTHIYPPLWAVALVNPTMQEVEQTYVHHPQRPICIGTLALDGKMIAPTMPINALSQFADYILVEADGAKHLPLKAPDLHEPVLPDGTELVIAVAGLDGIGRPIKKVAFRADRYAGLLDVSEEHIVTPEDVARILIHASGQRKAVAADMRYCIVLNKVDTEECVALADRVSRCIPRSLADRVLYTSFMRRGQDAYID